MTPKRKQAALAFGRFSSSPEGIAVLTQRKAQGIAIMPVDESEPWSNVVDELQGQGCLLAVRRSDGRFDLVELVAERSRRPDAQHVHRDTTVGMIIDAMTALSHSGLGLRQPEFA